VQLFISEILKLRAAVSCMFKYQ